MSKESIIKKRLEQIEKENRSQETPQAKQQPAPACVPVIRRTKRRLNKKFIITFAIWLAALIAALFFLSRGTF
ncbi:MAG: hypothetical protein JXA46_18775 [Dehalococcoidales bacterium]|nr:hypothetical protein [Dehalococcoidales bacterium]